MPDKPTNSTSDGGPSRPEPDVTAAGNATDTAENDSTTDSHHTLDSHEAVGDGTVIAAPGGRRARRHRRQRGRLRRALSYLGVFVLVLLVTSTAGVLWYASTVPLPDEPQAPQATVLYYSDGRTELARLGVNSRVDVTIDRVPEQLRHAVLAAEDRAFYDHHGVSPRGVLRAVVANVREGSGEGASTITQQYARNAYLTQERTAGRKAREAVLAVKIEHRYTKDEILERYLNTVYFGRGAYGIGAAAVAYFGTSVSDLSLAQAAVLASVIKDPYNLDPEVDAQAARDRWEWVLDSMVEQGWADRSEVDQAAYPEVLAEAPGPAALSGPPGLIADQVEQELARAGITPQVLRTGGLRVVTTIDAQVQRAALDSVEATLRGQPAKLRAALVAVDPATGAVRGYYGGAQGQGYFDWALAARPPAATFTPLTLATGLRRGIALASRWNGASPRLFADRYGVPLYNRGDRQCASCTLREALTLDLSTPFYALAERVGPASVRSFAVSAGISERYDKQRSLVDEKGAPEPGHTRADIALGRYPVSPADLASAYATLAGGGTARPRHFVERVSDASGHSRYTAPGTAHRVLVAGAAGDVAVALASAAGALGLGGDPLGGFVVGTGKARTGQSTPMDRPVAAISGAQRLGDTKTNTDAWTAGYATQLAAVVWIGREVPGALRDRAGHAIDGAMPTGLWRSFMTAALAGAPALPLPAAGSVGDLSAGDASGASSPAGGGQAGNGGQSDSGKAKTPTDRGAPTGQPSSPAAPASPAPDVQDGKGQTAPAGGRGNTGPSPDPDETIPDISAADTDNSGSDSEKSGTAGRAPGR